SEDSDHGRINFEILGDAAAHPAKLAVCRGPDEPFSPRRRGQDAGRWRHDEPGRNVSDESADETAGNNREYDPGETHECHVSIEIPGNARANAGYSAARREPQQPAWRRLLTLNRTAVAAEGRIRLDIFPTLWTVHEPTLQ